MILLILLCSISSFLITAISLVPIINWAKENNLTDQPSQRKIHQSPIPALGGIGIFSGMAMSFFIAKNHFDFSEFMPVAIALLAIFALGLYDDLKNANAKFRLIFQLVLATMLYSFDLKITGLYGLFGIGEFPEYLSLAVTVLAITLLINAYNLIDGVNGLAGSLGLVGTVAFACIFYFFNETATAAIASIFAGSLLGFLKHNFGKATVFMGDNGSTVLGLMMAFFFIKLINLPISQASHYPLLPIALSIILVPIFDVCRVFIYRISIGKSFFAADQAHIHHLFLKIGKTHTWIACFLSFITLTNIFLSIMGSYFLPMSTLLGILFGLMCSLVLLVSLSKSLSRLKSAENTRSQIGYYY